MTAATQHRTFAATATFEGKWWIDTVPELEVVTQARNVREIDEIDEMAMGLIIALLDLEEEDVTVNVTVELPAFIAERWEKAAALHAQAEADKQRATALRRSGVRYLWSTENMS